MSIAGIACPVCAAPIQVVAGVEYQRCPYCQSTLQIERSANRDFEASLARETSQTRSLILPEIQRMQLMQELGLLKSRLGTVQGEIRTLERAQSTTTTKRQLREVYLERDSIQQEIAVLETELQPQGAQGVAAATLQFNDTRPTWERFVSLLFVPMGRIAQAHFAAGIGILVLLLVILSPFLPMSEGAEGGSFAGLLMLGLIYIYGALAVKRYHDLDKSGWWVLIAFIPFGIFYQAYELLFVPGAVGANRYGAWPPQRLGDLVAPSVDVPKGFGEKMATDLSNEKIG